MGAHFARFEWCGAFHGAKRLKKALSFEAARLASQERVQQRPRPEPRFDEQPEVPSGAKRKLS